MDVEEARDDKTLLLTPKGRLDSQSADAFQASILRHIDNGEKSILLDFSMVDYMSSAGLRALLIAARQQKDNGGQLVICSMKEEVLEVVRVSGLDSIIAIYAEEETALEKLRQK